ncbi:hypothetical protein AA0118_g10504 [Alternaria tenuissima]|nr:hypothetical protein AA0118_g10504 [Alternaria tenuissima]
MAVLDQFEEFPIRRAATHPAAVTQYIRCPFSRARLHLILPQDDGDHLSEDSPRSLVSTMLQPEVGPVPEQLLKALLEELVKRSSLRTPSISISERRPRPTLHIDPLVAASGSGAIPSSCTPSLSSKCNRRNELEPYSPTPSTSSVASIHDDQHTFYQYHKR